MRASKVGTRVRLPDGREGVTVYNGLDGVGIKFMDRDLTEAEKELLLSLCPLLPQQRPEEFNLAPDAMLRNPYPAAMREGVECVGEEFEIIDSDTGREAK